MLVVFPSTPGKPESCVDITATGSKVNHMYSSHNSPLPSFFSVSSLHLSVYICDEFSPKCTRWVSKNTRNIQAAHFNTWWCTSNKCVYHIKWWKSKPQINTYFLFQQQQQNILCLSQLPSDSIECIIFHYVRYCWCNNFN